jgi:hypothetical protein
MAMWKQVALGTLGIAIAASCGSNKGGLFGSGGGSSSTSSSGSTGSSHVCAPGAQVTCGCPAGEPQSVQVCKPDGSGFGPCGCSGGSTSSGGHGGATSSSGHGGASTSNSSTSTTSTMSAASTTASSTTSTSSGTGGGDAGITPLSADQIPGLSLWLDSSKGTVPDSQYPMLVHIWADQSTHGNNASTTAYQQEPALINFGYKSFNVVEYNVGGALKILTINDDPSLHFGTGDFAVAMVMKESQMQTTPIFQRTDNGLVFSVDNNFNVVTPTAQAHAVLTASPTGWHIIVVRGAALEIRIDGVATAGTTNATDLSNPSSIWLGAVIGPNEYATIDWLQVIAYQGHVSDAQVAGLESYLKMTYGL